MSEPTINPADEAESTLTAKQQAFVMEYLVDLNATQAAIRAGYSENTAASIGYENLTKPLVHAAIAAAMQERAKRTEVTQDYVLSTITETIERCKQAVPVLDRKGQPVIVETEDGQRVPAYVFEPNAVIRGAELLGRHLGMFIDKVQHSGSISIEQLLAEVRRKKKA